MPSTKSWESKELEVVRKLATSFQLQSDDGLNPSLYEEEA